MRIALLPGDSPDHGQDDQDGGGGGQKNSRKRRRRVIFEEDDDDEEAASAPARPSLEMTADLSCTRGGSAGVSTAKTPGDEALQGWQDKQQNKRLNTVMKLRSREIGFCRSIGRPLGSGSFMPRPPSFSQEVFSAIENQTVFDIYGLKGDIRRFERPIKKRSAVLQILPLKDIVAVVLCSGLGFVLSRVTNKLVAILNNHEDEVIASIFWKKEDKSLIMNSTRLSVDPMIHRLTSKPLKFLGSNDKNSGHQIFETENIKWPDNVEFCAPNARALIKQKSTYRVFDLTDYSLLYQIPELEQVHNAHPFRIYSAESFEEMHSFMLINISKRLEIEPILHDKIIIKEKFANENGHMQILGLHSSNMVKVPIGKFHFHALHGRNLFLSFQEKSTELRDLQGNVVRNFEDHVLSEMNNVNDKLCVTEDEDVVISQCKSEGFGAVHISSIETRKCITTINNKVVVSALAYNPDLNEIYIGTSRGELQIWSWKAILNKPEQECWSK
uniref:Uncharacterized protein n=1 Tax=Leersia perrieri TaxID=77586 RepID=A0A0D9VCF4_9ORYZ